MAKQKKTLHRIQITEGKQKLMIKNLPHNQGKIEILGKIRNNRAPIQ